MESKILMDKDIGHDILQLNEPEQVDVEQQLLEPNIDGTLYKGTRSKDNPSGLSSGATEIE